MASYDTWIKFYRPDESSPNHTISYYTKGSLIGLCLDLLLRGESGGRRGLDDVLRLLFERYGRHDTGFPEAAYKAAVEEVAGHPMDDFWRRYVDGTEVLDPAGFLARAGLDLSRRNGRSARDGDRANRAVAAAADDDAAGGARPFAGIVMETREGRLYARNVLADTPAERGGLNTGDELLALDGFRTESAERLRARVADRAPGEEVEVTLSRRGEVSALRLRLAEAPADEYRIRGRADADAEARRVYESWVGRPYPPVGGLDSEPAGSRRRGVRPNLV
jgi:predicted metalloprotease with PDZ domain